MTVHRVSNEAKKARNEGEHGILILAFRALPARPANRAFQGVDNHSFYVTIEVETG